MDSLSFWQCYGKFYSGAEDLRRFYDQQFRDPRELHENRFVWDYWHVPEQYTLLRTPAYNYFPKEMYDDFSDHLIRWGQKNLGCSNISAPWLSCYIDGCFQEIHADNIHGPWAFVFSLTPNWEARKFEGGLTRILQPSVLNYWQNHDLQKGQEAPHLLHKLESPFNQLTIFDPRIPHGVEEVRGSRDPREGRLVIHGWFTEPQPFIDGTLDPDKAAAPLDEILEHTYEDLDSAGVYSGVISLRLQVKSEGDIDRVDVLTNTLIPLDGTSKPNSDILKLLEARLMSGNLPESDGETTITLPFVFQ